MRITIICVGKVKEKYFREALSEYSKRLSKYCKLDIIEVDDEKTNENAGEHEMDITMEKEAARILSKIPDNSYVISTAIEGKKYDSVGLSKMINQKGISGCSHITFIIGGSLGLHKTVKDVSSELISFSDMTFPHQLMRVILLEQIYRSYRIINNEPYHK